jgi:hypothetical protein
MRPQQNSAKLGASSVDGAGAVNEGALAEVQQRYLPPLLQEMADLIGLAATLEVVRFYGGTRVWIPTHFDSAHPLIGIIGHQHFAALVQRFCKNHLDIPKADIAIKAARDARIRQLRHSKSVTRLAREFGLTERHIRNILGPDAPDTRQSGFGF